MPDFVRASLARAAIPGYKVFRWERQWHSPGQPFQGSRRVSQLRPWRRPARMTPSRWRSGGSRRQLEERRAVLEIPSIRELIERGERARAIESAALSSTVRTALLEALFASRLEPAHPADSGRVRLARSHQSARDRRRSELDVAAAVADRSDVTRAGGDRRSRSCVSGPNATAVESTSQLLPLIFAQVSFSVTVRLNTGVPGVRIGIDAEVALPLELEA